MARTPAKKIELEPGYRKAPQQRRSALTVQSILQATIEIAAKEGFKDLGSRRIAERAGVSVGSLYRFFPTVDTILLAIYEEAASRMAKNFRAKMLSLMHHDMKTLGRKSLEVLLKEYEQNQLILHRMAVEVPHVLQTPGIASLDQLLLSGLRIYFMQFKQLTNKDIERVCFFLKVVIIGSLRDYLNENRPPLSRNEFIDNLNMVMVSYVHSQGWNLPTDPIREKEAK